MFRDPENPMPKSEQLWNLARSPSPSRPGTKYAVRGNPSLRPLFAVTFQDNCSFQTCFKEGGCMRKKLPIPLASIPNENRFMQFHFFKLCSRLFGSFCFCKPLGKRDRSNTPYDICFEGIHNNI